ncbi:MAG: nucleotidyltransferase family protein [Acidobacteriota bacterium]
MQKTRPRTKTQVIKLLGKELPYLRERYGVARLALFGSYAKGKPRQASDVDLLVELERPLGLEFVELANDLEKSLGKKVDIATFDSFKRSLTHPLYRSIAEDVERTLVNVY